MLKAKCPVLVENMIHSSMGLVGNEAFGLLLKRPWNPVVGLHTVEKQVRVCSEHAWLLLCVCVCVCVCGSGWVGLVEGWSLYVIGSLNPLLCVYKPSTVLVQLFGCENMHTSDSFISM